MSEKTVAILMPGDMGHGVGRALVDHGVDVITCLAGRSDHTRALAEKAGLRDVADLDAVAAEAAMILSILPPAEAPKLAEDVARAIERAGTRPVYVDCNAISPATAVAVGDTVAAAGARFIDCGIIGLKPKKTDQGWAPGPRFYVSGADVTAMEACDGMGFRVKTLGPKPGRASAMKMCYASLTKGTWTLQTAVMLAAAAEGLIDELTEEFEGSQPGALQQMRGRIPSLPADSGRWIGEMEEIAKTYAEAGVTPGFHEGAAEIFRVLAETPFAAETRETLDPNRTLEETIEAALTALRAREKN